MHIVIYELGLKMFCVAHLMLVSLFTFWSLLLSSKSKLVSDWSKNAVCADDLHFTNGGHLIEAACFEVREQ